MKGKHVVFLLGLPRSNTTFIHRTLATHSQIYAPTLVDLLFPFDTISSKIGRLLFKSIPQTLINRVYNPNIHLTGAQYPEALDAAIFKKYQRGVLAWVHKDALKGIVKPRFEKEDLAYIDQLIEHWIKTYPNKTICLKYFYGIHIFEELKEQFPGAKFIISTRKPATIVASSASLIEMVLKARHKKVGEAYWQLIYKNIVDGCRIATMLTKEHPSSFLLSTDETLKSDSNLAFSKMTEYIGLEPLPPIVRPDYKRKYAYGEKLDFLYKESDFIYD